MTAPIDMKQCTECRKYEHEGIWHDVSYIDTYEVEEGQLIAVSAGVCPDCEVEEG